MTARLKTPKRIAAAGMILGLVWGAGRLLGTGPPAAPAPRYAGFADIDPAKNTICLVGDTQQTLLWEFWRERNDKERRLILRGIADRDPAFVINLGDMTAWGSSEAQWREFDRNHRFFLERRIPLFPLVGNHSTYGPDAKALRLMFERFPGLDGRRYYSFVWKGIGFVILDSNFRKMSGQDRAAQRDWYLSELERFNNDASVDLVIAACHEAPYTNNLVIKPSFAARTEFAEPFAEFAKTAVFFSGHSHSYEKFRIRDKTFVVSGGGGGPRHRLDIDSRKRPYDDLYPGAAVRFFHFCEIARTADGLLIMVLRLKPDGSFDIADQFAVAKRPKS